PADLIYGGTTGALAATAEAGRRLGVPFALDLEDFHSQEVEGSAATLTNGLAARIESSILGAAAFLTTGSTAIAAAYRDLHGVLPTVLNNTFPYILPGLAVAMTDTPGQHDLGTDIASAAGLVLPGDVDALASVLQRWAVDPAALERSKRAAWDAAVRRWHWEDPHERGSL